MPVERGDALPQLGEGVFLTDGGIETYLIFHRNLDLPEFAAFDLLKDEAGRDELRAYYRPFMAMAAERDLGFVLRARPGGRIPAGRSALAMTPTSLRRRTAPRSP